MMRTAGTSFSPRPGSYHHPVSPTVENTTPAPTAWSTPELANPHESAQKAAKVRGMFAAIAGSYDLNNRLHSLWRDQAWRRFAVKAAEPRAGEHVLDVACGTGDLTFAFARTNAAKIVGCDFTPEMLKVADQKLVKSGAAPTDQRVRFQWADAMALPFADASFDIVSIAFGIRNVTDPAKALGEFARVLRPGGRLIVLEFDQPRFAPLRWFNALYCQRIMPKTATLIAHDTSGAYKYLPASVSTFMSREKMGKLIEDAGFEAPRIRSLSLGICACYRANVKK